MAKVTRIVNMERCIGCNLCAFACARINSGTVSLDKSAVSVKYGQGNSSSHIVTLCRACKEPACVDSCKTGALVLRNGGGVKLKGELCDSCSACVDACLIGAIHLDTPDRKPVVCIHCGACVDFCPHSVLVSERRKDA